MKYMIYKTMLITYATSLDIPKIVEFGKRLTKLHFEFDPAYYTFDEVGFYPLFSDWLKTQVGVYSSFVLIAKENDQIVGFLLDLRSIYFHGTK